MEYIVRKQIESRRAYEQRQKTIGFAMILALALSVALAVLLMGCGTTTALRSGTIRPPVRLH
jgi:hypothetical protein